MTLDDYVTEHLSRPFAWGANDCVTFAVGWLNRQAGCDFLAALPRWTSARGASFALRTVGRLETEFTRQLQVTLPTAARDGDVTVQGRTALLFVGSRLAAPGPNGLLFFNRTIATCAWSLRR